MGERRNGESLWTMGSKLDRESRLTRLIRLTGGNWLARARRTMCNQYCVPPIHGKSKQKEQKHFGPHNYHSISKITILSAKHEIAQ